MRTAKEINLIRESKDPKEQEQIKATEGLGRTKRVASTAGTKTRTGLRHTKGMTTEGYGRARQSPARSDYSRPGQVRPAQARAGHYRAWQSKSREVGASGTQRCHNLASSRRCQGVVMASNKS